MKDVKDIRGIVMPILTPFQEDSELDEPMGCELADFLIASGVHALFLEQSRFIRRSFLNSDE